MFLPKDPGKLFPLQVNEATGEPYLQLPWPHDKIRITPARPSDAASIQECLNDPRVYEYLAGPPFPYTYDDAIQWVGRAMDESGRLFWSMEDGDEWIDGCPVHCIRQVQEDGTDIYIGDITMRREGE
jgi:RimJ/RimL family protein N-acetyltransferase